MLTGALIGQLVPTPALALAGGFVSHLVLDAMPHTDAATFEAPRDRGVNGAKSAVCSISELVRHLLRPDILEAGLEFFVGVLILGWMIDNCPGINALSVAIGAFAALIPDFIGLPLERFCGANIHPAGLHWTVARRHAVWGILTQVAVAGLAGWMFWRISGCG